MYEEENWQGCRQSLIWARMIAFEPASLSDLFAGRPFIATAWVIAATGCQTLWCWAPSQRLQQEPWWRVCCERCVTSARSRCCIPLQRPSCSLPAGGRPAPCASESDSYYCSACIHN